MKQLLKTGLAFVIGLGIMAVFVFSRQLDDEPDEPRHPDLLAYCMGEHGEQARTYLQRPSVFGWRCLRQPDTPTDVVAIDIDAVCQTQFGVGYVADFGVERWPYDWDCVRP